MAPGGLDTVPADTVLMATDDCPLTTLMPTKPVVDCPFDKSVPLMVTTSPRLYEAWGVDTVIMKGDCAFTVKTLDRIIIEKRKERVVLVFIF